MNDKFLMLCSSAWSNIFSYLNITHTEAKPAQAAKFFISECICGALCILMLEMQIVWSLFTGVICWGS